MSDSTYSIAGSEYAIGLDLGGTVLKFGIVDGAGNMLFEDSLPSRARAGREKIQHQLLDAVSRSREIARLKDINISCVGLGTPGTIDSRGRVQGELPNLPEWRGFAVIDFLREISGDSVAVENDANLMALAEACTGAGKGFATVFGITFGTGIGGGFIIGGKLYTGTGGAGEIGHTTVVPRGRSCPCGRRGCMERYGSVPAIEETYLNWTGIRKPIREIIDLFITEDSVAKDVIEESFMYSSQAIIDMLQILCPECVVVGGGLMDIHTQLFQLLAEKVLENAPETVGKKVRIRKAVHGNMAGVIGAGIHALRIKGYGKYPEKHQDDCEGSEGG